MTVIAFLGIGAMGEPMARRCIEAGLTVKLWNRSPAKLSALAAMGGAMAATPKLAAEGAEIICLCLSDAAAVEAVVFGRCGVTGSATEGALIVDFSSISPAETRRMAEQVKRNHGLRWIDCPVSGGVRGASGGTLTVLAGGSSADVAAATAVLEAVAARVTHMGETGAGQAAKLANQLIVSTTLLAIAEALALAERLGIDPSAIPEALRGGFADSAPLQIFGPRMAAARDPGPPVSALATMMKDIEMVLAAAHASGVDLPLIERVAARYGAIIADGRGGEDLPVLMRLYRGPADKEPSND